MAVSHLGRLPPVLRVTSFRVLGAHATGDGQSFDGADMILDTDEGLRVFGFRTAGYVGEHDPFARDYSGPITWDGEYEPLAITLDRRTVRFWDFSELMWLGPDPHPCLVWSNAAGLSVRGMQCLLSPVGSGNIFNGPGGRGLPTPDALGLVVPDGLAPIVPIRLDEANDRGSTGRRFDEHLPLEQIEH